MSHCVTLLFAFLLLPTPVVTVADPPSTTAPAATTRLALHVNPIVDLHDWVRTLATLPAAPAEPLEIPQAIGHVRDIEAHLGPVGWSLIEPLLGRVDGLAAARALAERLPERQVLPRVGATDLRAPVLGLLDSYIAMEPHFREQVWPAHERELLAARNWLEENFAPKSDAVLSDVVEHLAMRDPRLTIPVYLVAEAPPPGGVTHRARDGGGVCFVGLNGARGSRLAEIVLHEATHALDAATAGQPTVLEQLRGQLRDLGVTPADKVYRDLPHTLLFVQSAATIRRLVAPDHVDYGQQAGYYEKVGPLARDVRKIWLAHLAGELPRNDAIARLAALGREHQSR